MSNHATTSSSTNPVPEIQPIVQPIVQPIAQPIVQQTWGLWFVSGLKNLAISYLPASVSPIMVDTIDYAASTILGNNGRASVPAIGIGGGVCLGGAYWGGKVGVAAVVSGGTLVVGGVIASVWFYNNRVYAAHNEEHRRLNGTQAQHIATLGEQVANLTEQVNRIQGMTDEQRTERQADVQRLNTEWNRLQGEVSALNTVKVGLQASVDRLQGQITRLSQQIDRLQTQ